MPKITVITPTVRPEGLALVAKALKRQTFKDFEWIICLPNPTQKNKWSNIPLALTLNSVQPNWDEELNISYDPTPNEGDAWTLNKGYNKAIKEAQGDLIVSWQDYTFAKPDALEKFWNHYDRQKNLVVSGVGNKYKDETWTVATWQDPRRRQDQGTFYPCYFCDIEFNFAAIPRDAFYAVGGFDESMDARYGMDGYSVVDRLNILGGWEFYLDQTNETFSLEHGRLNGDKWDKNNWIGEPYNKHREAYLENPKLPYLS